MAEKWNACGFVNHPCLQTYRADDRRGNLILSRNPALDLNHLYHVEPGMQEETLKDFPRVASGSPGMNFLLQNDRLWVKKVEGRVYPVEAHSCLTISPFGFQ